VVEAVRTEGFKEWRITCDHCGAFCGTAEIHEGGMFKGEEMCAAEVWFNPPGGRGGIMYTDESGENCVARTEMHDSCNACAAKVMRIVDSFYDRDVADDLEPIRMVVREEIERSQPKVVLHDETTTATLREMNWVKWIRNGGGRL
jgi:hypothetical protein